MIDNNADLQEINESIQALSGKVGFLSDNLTQRLDAMDQRIDSATFLAMLALLMSISLVCLAGIWFFL
ncbi:MAG: hypothetical protein ACRC7J_03225 [Vibrio ordalii]|uniref:hypothetical protein n=1 Tax=Vibrio ordalii TaxID=28174 RepID=UPI003F307FF8